MFSNFKLGTKFSLLLSFIALCGILIAGFIFWQLLNRRAQTEVTDQGIVLIETMNAVRNYTSAHIKPLLLDQLETEESFVSETVPAFSAREVFELFRQRNSDHEAFFYKEATVNPTNPRDLADAFEVDLIDQMIANPGVSELSGFRTLEEDSVFYIARPLYISSEDCLTCHGDPADAPASLLVSYGDENGFGWEMGQVISAQIIYLPAQDVFSSALQAFALSMSIFVGTIIAMIVVLNFLLKAYVIQPVGALGRLANKISKDNMTGADRELAELQAVSNRQDELGHLGRVVIQMAQDVEQRTEQLKTEIRQLRIAIDKTKQAEAVSEIVETDFFRSLQAKAKDMRRRRDERGDRKSE